MGRMTGIIYLIPGCKTQNITCWQIRLRIQSNVFFTHEGTEALEGVRCVPTKCLQTHSQSINKPHLLFNIPSDSLVGTFLRVNHKVHNVAGSPIPIPTPSAIFWSIVKPPKFFVGLEEIEDELNVLVLSVFIVKGVPSVKLVVLKAVSPAVKAYLDWARYRSSLIRSFCRIV